MSHHCRDATDRCAGTTAAFAFPGENESRHRRSSAVRATHTRHAVDSASMDTNLGEHGRGSRASRQPPCQATVAGGLSWCIGVMLVVERIKLRLTYRLVSTAQCVAVTDDGCLAQIEIRFLLDVWCGGSSELHRRRRCWLLIVRLCYAMTPACHGSARALQARRGGVSAEQVTRVLPHLLICAVWYADMTVRHLMRRGPHGFLRARHLTSPQLRRNLISASVCRGIFSVRNYTCHREDGGFVNSAPVTIVCQVSCGTRGVRRSRH